MNLFFLITLLTTPLLTLAAPAPSILLPSHPLLARSIPYDKPPNTNTTSKIRPYTLPKLPYPSSGLEPIISTQLIQLHHDKHHQAYIDALNTQLALLASSAQNLSTLLSTSENIRFNGGGHINHSLFWENLAQPNSSATKYPDDDEMMVDKIRAKWKSWDGLKKAVVEAGMSVKGSGWVWLAMDGSPGGEGALQIVTKANQETILEPLVPIVGIDVW